MSSQLRHLSTIGKNLLNSNVSPTCPHNMVNFGPLMAEICWRVCGTSPHFNRFHILAALLHCTLVVGVSPTAALNRGRHLYLAGRPSRWALAHILVMVAVWNRAGHYIFALWFPSFCLLSFFFPCLISAAADWMSTILRYMM